MDEREQPSDKKHTRTMAVNTSCYLAWIGLLIGLAGSMAQKTVLSAVFHKLKHTKNGTNFVELVNERLRPWYILMVTTNW